MKYLSFFLLTCSFPCFGAMSTSGQESEHFDAEFWQRADGKYCIKINVFPEVQDHLNHMYIFDTLMHSDECECEYYTR